MKGIDPLQDGMNAADMRFGIVAARFNDSIVDRLLQAAQETLARHGAAGDAIQTVRVPGAFELPLAVKAMVRTERCDAVIALGCVIRGDTPHFDFVAGECTRGLSQIALDHEIPVAFGVLTTDTEDQALQRAGVGGSNKGAEVAAAAIEMVAVLRGLNR